MRRTMLTGPGAYGFAVASVAVCTLVRLEFACGAPGAEQRANADRQSRRRAAGPGRRAVSSDHAIHADAASAE